MIQRIQTLWLFLAALCAALSFYFPFYSGQKLFNETPAYAELTATYNVPIILFTTIGCVGALHAIFTYAKRKYQLTVVMLTLIASIINIVLLFIAATDFMDGRLALTAALSFAVPVFLFLALGGIRSDEKLVKSMDRLR